MLGREGTLGGILAKRPKAASPVGGAIPKTLVRTLQRTMARQLGRLRTGPEPRALPLDRFVDIPRLGSVLEAAQLVSDISRRNPLRKVAEFASTVMPW